MNSLLRFALPTTSIVLLVAAAFVVLPEAEAAMDAPDPLTATAPELYTGGLYVEPDTAAEQAVARFEEQGRSSQADLLRKISSQPTAIWLGDWYETDLLVRVITRNLDAAAAEGTTPVFVNYAIPNRDCGGYSRGGFEAADYLEWTRTIADTMRGSRAVVLLEPDSLAMLSADKCATEVDTRPALLRDAVEILTDAGLTVYLDGGNNYWIAEHVMADRLTAAGVSMARGFFTNVSNFYPVNAEREYGDALSALLGGKNYVTDVSRNGTGWQGTWCNPTGAGLGEAPHATDGSTKLDALLWVKHPGLSDGTCNGGPEAGEWWDEGALELARNA
ncbi:glycoside hydrolase family 6 protein [Salinibacterium sp. ZJ454]|uniref:glycoside hydrolase family 6 protein n=1 Tax=Salinibacterium sp. ZJ454 TaxID=2708339 RepID=UPI00142483B1|nr:glycoside hydrolase family 6 protein [Salinibacterium sp. ZJ454]